MVELVPVLESSQEEADARMMLHLTHMYQDDFACAVIASIDADMPFLCLANYHKFSMTLFQKCSLETRMNYVDIASIGNVLGCYVCSFMINSIASPSCVPSTCYAMPCIVTL